jgi:hypothetical protein
MTSNWTRSRANAHRAAQWMCLRATQAAALFMTMLLPTLMPMPMMLLLRHAPAVCCCFPRKNHSVGVTLTQAVDPLRGHMGASQRCKAGRCTHAFHSIPSLHSRAFPDATVLMVTSYSPWCPRSTFVVTCCRSSVMATHAGARKRERHCELHACL